MSPQAGRGEGFGRLLGRHLATGTAVALAVGGAVGCVLGLLFVSLDSSDLVLQRPGSGVAAVALLTSLGALLAAAALLPAELLAAAWQGLRGPDRRRASPLRLYSSLLTAGLAGAAVFLHLGFNVIRNLKTPQGAAAAAACVVVPLGAVWLFSRPRFDEASRGRPSPGPIAARSPARSAVWLAAVLAVLAATAAAAHALLRTERSPTADPTRPPAGVETTTAEAPPSGGPGSPLPASASPVPGGAEEMAPDVLLISIDTLRADHLGAYGYARPTTPHIDALAADGILFERAYSPAPWTLPAHASMLTGLYPWSHGVRFSDNSRFLNSRTADVLAGRHLTIAEALRAKGWATAAFTSSRWLSRSFGLDQGFERLEMSFDAHPAPVLVDKGLDWLRRERDRPAFLFLHFFDVHQYEAPERFFRAFHDGGYEGKVRGRERRSMGNLWQSLDDEDLRYLVARYDAALAFVDEELGRLLAWLRESGRYERTLIVLTSDHGEEFWDHGGTGHGFTLYEELIRVPLVLKPPGPAAPRRSAHPVGLVDLVPTLLDHLGLPAPPALDGVSLRPLAAGVPIASRPLYSGASFLQSRAAVLDSGRKLIVNRLPPLEPFRAERWLTTIRTFYKFGPTELYALDEDPRERADLAAREQARVRGLEELLFEELRRGAVGEDREMDAETVEELRALGYL